MYGTGFRISSKEQEVLYVNPKAIGDMVKRVIQMLVISHGFREYVYLRLEFGGGGFKYYLNETDGASLKEIEDDQLFSDLSAFIDEHHSRIKPEGSPI
jgi:hypothetical protein